MTRMKVATAAAALLATTGGTVFAASEQANVCEQGYSMTDVNNDGYVSPIEANAYAERQAKDMDADASASVSRDEYINCATSAMPGTERERTNAFAEPATVDGDGDGSISRQEYMTHASMIAENAAGGDDAAVEEAQNLFYTLESEGGLDYAQTPLEELMIRAKAGFFMLDTDQSGDLSEAEYNATAFQPADLTEVLNTDFDMIDADGSDDLTQSELIEANANRAERAMREAGDQTGEAMDPEVGAPVVYYIYPHVM